MATRWAHLVAGFDSGLGPDGQAAAGPPLIAVVAYNQAGMAADTLARAKSEVTRIYGEAGIGVTWMDPAAPEPAGAFAIQLLIRRRAVNGSDSVMGTTIGDTPPDGRVSLHLL